MESPQVISVERFRSGAIIEFDDGKCAVYSATLLLKFYDEAIPVVGQDEEPGDEGVASTPDSCNEDSGEPVA
jgi:hypothetical protein